MNAFGDNNYRLPIDEKKANTTNIEKTAAVDKYLL
jgi:hypothetical protein